MHPNTFSRTLFDPAKRDEVFVIMSFDSEFDERWQQIIEPVIREDLKLIPNRVDYNRSGENVIHDILDGIAHSRLVLAEITSSEMMDTSRIYWPQRNGNVMWELGVAHVMRMPDEVVIIRSDRERTIFDLTQFRAFDYDPEDFAASREMLKTLLGDRLISIDQSKSYHVKICANSLDFNSWLLLLSACLTGEMRPPVIRNLGEILRGVSTIPAITRLLEMGALSTEYPLATVEILKTSVDLPSEELLKYKVTPFGIAVAKYIADQMGVGAPDLQSELERLSAEMPD